ncbi:MAG: enolase [Candidatus Berkelbacteria bacterium Licking1014_85]|uniref:Enolase n=1 Tax=Candidatus Berkelbacteria bacterium Licking1014_85 TaxID=2017148 RepID=A0A554LLK6_9BACT|nr:MAG: enolase [Candidatus Berkelbacteria bacterium Licking1014_85]
MAKIARVKAQKIYDSRGIATIEVALFSDSGEKAIASVPSGAFSGKYEAHTVETDKAIENVNTIISQNIIGRDPTNQTELDNLLITLDGTPNKASLGANSILGVSIASARLASSIKKIPLFLHLQQIFSPQIPVNRLPSPMFNVINGGAHANNGLSFQEFMITPIEEGMSFSQKMEIGCQIFKKLEEILKKMNKTTGFGDEGGFSPKLNSNEEAIEILISAITEAGFTPRTQVAVSLDVAADFIKDLSAVTYPRQPLQYYEQLINDYPIEMLEDPFHDDDWLNWQQLTIRLGNRISIVGDDFFSTNILLLKKGVENKVANAISIKPNQIGTVTETMQTIDFARKNNISYQISHRSGETEDTFIADLAVATAAKYFKSGAPNRGERVAKYNQLLRIEKELFG